MSVQEYLDEDTMYRSSRRGASTLSRRILVAYPSERIVFSIAVKEPVSHVVQVEAEGLPRHVASITINPNVSTAPFTSSIIVSVSRGAIPGNYPFNLEIYDATDNRPLGLEHMVLIVLDSRVPKVFAKHHSKLIELYRRYGAQATIWYLLSHVFTEDATFSQLKASYELVVQKRVSNGTIGSILERMKKKKIVIEKQPGLYVTNIKDFSILLSRIDLSRVRPQANMKKESLKKTSETTSEDANEDVKEKITKLPKPIECAWEHTQEIANEHGALAALYFLLHSLLGAEATGYLLYWLNTWFIVCRSKTSFYYHFYSSLLHEMLRRLGLREGIQYNYFREWEHLNAQRIAQEYIREYYMSHPNARRLHYMLKERGYLWYDGDIYTLKIYHYDDGKIGLEIYDDRGEELLHSDSVREHLTPSKTEIKTAFPFEHIDEQNEDTYFTRPAGLY